MSPQKIGARREATGGREGCTLELRDRISNVYISGQTVCKDHCCISAENTHNLDTVEKATYHMF